MGNYKGFVAVALCTGVLMTAAPALCANDIQAKLAEQKAAQAETARKAKALETELDNLKNRLVKTAKDMRSLEIALTEGENNLKELNQKKSIYLSKIYKNEERIGGLIAAARKYKSASTPQMLAQSKPIDAARAAIVMKSVLPTLNRQSSDLRQELLALEKIENNITAQLAANKNKIRFINDKKEETDKLLEERQISYKKTEKERKVLEAEVAQLAREAKNLDDLVKKIKPLPKPAAEKIDTAAVTRSNFKMPADSTLPVQGRIVSGFDETDEMGAKSKGVTFLTRSGATVVTPLSGTVKFAGPFQKYKQILIIEHQGGYHSLIAGLGRIDTVVGASLASGEPVGLSENSADDSRIYYELRHQGLPVNPKKLNVAQRKQVKS